MDKIITIICNVILFLLLIFNVNNYADFVLNICLITQICLLIFYSVRYRKRYIDKTIIFLNIICLFIQIALIGILGILDIWKVSSGFMGLGGGPFGILLYFISHIIFIILMLIINAFKYFIKRTKNSE